MLPLHSSFPLALVPYVIIKVYKAFTNLFLLVSAYLIALVHSYLVRFSNKLINKWYLFKSLRRDLK